MKQIVYTLRVFPEENITDLDNLLNKIVENLRSGKVVASQAAEYFFGMKILLLNVEAPELDGISDRIEEEIRKTDGVSEMEIVSVTRKVEVWRKGG
jgi:translation elongation factor aEF-1 beta